MPASHTPRRLRPLLVAAALALPLTAGAVGVAGSARAQDGAPNPAELGSDIDPTGPGADEPTGTDPVSRATALARLQAAAPDDLWAIADATALPVDALWDPAQGAYVAQGFARARLNAEMLLVHAYAAVAGHTGSAAHPERIEPLVRLLTGPMFVATLNGRRTPAPKAGRSETVHAPGFADATGKPDTMHQALDAVALRALAAAWQARDVVDLSPEARALIQDRVQAVARSPFWGSDSRLLNQINWNADVYAADAAVSGDATLLRREYRAQLLWFTSHARRTAYPKGSSNLSSGLGFRYAPNRPASNVLNRTDTSEYASTVLGALSSYDEALRAGMRPLPAADRDLLRRWTQRVAYGDWTAAGYLNWDSGKSVQRLYLTQYWLLGLRGFVIGIAGSAQAGFLSGQQAIARGVALSAIEHYRQQAAVAKSVVLPSSAFGFRGSSLVTDTFDGLTGTARFTSLVAELAARGLSSAAGATSRLPDAWAHDADPGRLAVTTSRYSTAILAPWEPLRVGGLEPARLLDARGRALTGLGGGRDGALDLRVSAGAVTLAETQPGRVRAAQSRLIVPGRVRDHSGRLLRPLTVGGSDEGGKVRLTLSHRFTATGIRTSYAIRNGRATSVQADLLIPTYGRGGRSSLQVGQRLGRRSLARLLKITTASGSRFDVRLRGLPGNATGTVVRVAGQRGNPTPGPQLRVRMQIAPGTTRLGRTITVPAAR